ncbi:MAG: phage terminase small subunit P27 family [Xanthobacteraceae bacterium]
MRGRKPNLKVIEGGAAQPQSRCPSVPTWLAPQAKAEWRRAAPELHSRNLLTPDTLATLESYCVAVGIVRESEETMRNEGRLIQTEKGQKPHPAIKIQANAMREARLLAAELGLTPHRRGVKGKPKGAGDDWDSDLLA